MSSNEVTPSVFLLTMFGVLLWIGGLAMWLSERSDVDTSVAGINDVAAVLMAAGSTVIIAATIMWAAARR